MDPRLQEYEEEKLRSLACRRNAQFLRTIVLIGCVKSVREGEGVQNLCKYYFWAQLSMRSEWNVVVLLAAEVGEDVLGAEEGRVARRRWRRGRRRPGVVVLLGVVRVAGADYPEQHSMPLLLSPSRTDLLTRLMR